MHLCTKTIAVPRIVLKHIMMLRNDCVDNEMIDGWCPGENTMTAKT